jgi:hypothetical protein
MEQGSGHELLQKVLRALTAWAKHLSSLSPGTCVALLNQGLWFGS